MEMICQILHRQVLRIMGDKIILHLVCQRLIIVPCQLVIRLFQHPQRQQHNALQQFGKDLLAAVFLFFGFREHKLKQG